MDTILWPLAVTWEPVIFMVLPVVILLAMLISIVKRYRRCPANKVLVVYGRVGGERAAHCIHGGGAFVWPIIQDYDYMSLAPIAIEIDLEEALSRHDVRVNLSATFTVGISTRADLLQVATERLLGLSEDDIASRASDIIVGQLRLTVATSSIEEMHQDQKGFLELISKNVGFELNKIGLSLLNVSLGDILDESGYLEAVGMTGRVQLKIPVRGAGCGLIQLTVDGHPEVVEAVSAGQEVEPSAAVRVVGIEAREALVVERL